MPYVTAGTRTTLTAGELAAQLAACPPELPVVVYEPGDYSAGIVDYSAEVVSVCIVPDDTPGADETSPPLFVQLGVIA